MATALREDDENHMDLAEGIKNSLTKYGLTRTKILNYSASELASLNVDEYVAILILNAAKSASIVVNQ